VLLPDIDLGFLLFGRSGQDLVAVTWIAVELSCSDRNFLRPRARIAFWLLRSGSYTSPADPLPMEQHRQLFELRDHRSLLGIFPPRLRKLPPPSPQITVFSKGPRNVSALPAPSSCEYRSPSLLMPFCGSLSPEFLRPGRNPESNLLATLQNRRGLLWSGHTSVRSVFHSFHLLSRTLRVKLLGAFLHPFVVFLDAFV